MDTRNAELRRNYTYEALSELREFDKAGKLKKTESRREEILVLGGRTFYHLVEKDRKPLPPREAAKEKERLDRAAAAAARLTPEARAKEERDAARERAKDREHFQHVPDAFDFALLGDEVLEGRAVWKIHAAPRRDYSGPWAFAFRHLDVTLWIDKQDYAWVKVDAVALDTISFGLFLARVAKGSRMQFESSKVNGELWAPKHVALNASARVALLKTVGGVQEIWFSNYRKFQADSRITGIEEAEEEH